MFREWMIVRNEMSWARPIAQQQDYVFVCIYICTFTVIILKCCIVINTTVKTTNALSRT